MSKILTKKYLLATISAACMVASAIVRDFEPTKNEFKIVSPVPSGSTVEPISQVPRLDTLQGKTIALVGGSFSASVTHAVIRDMLVEEFGCRIYFMEEYEYSFGRLILRDAGPAFPVVRT